VGSIRTNENIGKLVKLTVSTLQLPASRINIGAAQYVTPALTLNTAVTGVGGCDVAVAANSVYYTYAVVSSNVVYLIASLSSSLPAGFTQARKVGAFTTGTTSQILEAFYYGQGAVVWSTQPVAVTGSWTTNTTYSAKETRIGQLAKYEVKVSLSGAPNAAGLYINLPENRTIDTAALLNTVANNTLGMGTIRDFGVAEYVATVGYANTTRVYVGVLGSAVTYVNVPAYVTASVPHTFAINDDVYIEFTVPIAEWFGGGTQFVW
jgi:hypothetical protein